MKNFISNKSFAVVNKRMKILLFTTFVFFVSQNLTFADNYTEIPQRVIKFANKHHCTDLKKHTSFDRPFYGYKGYDVYIGDTIFEGEKEDCIILYKYGIVRFATFKEYLQIKGVYKIPPPLPIGLWWQYWHEYRKYGHRPLRELLFG